MDGQDGLRAELVYFAHRIGSVLRCDRPCPVLVCRGRYGWGDLVLLFVLGLKLGGVGPERGLREGGRRGWCETEVGPPERDKTDGPRGTE
jgi:hypothetical protein